MEAAFAALKIFLYGKKTKNEEKKNVFVKNNQLPKQLKWLITKPLKSSHRADKIK